MDIYIGNIHFELQEEHLLKLFAVYGKVEKITLLRDKNTNRSRGKAFVVMPDETTAKAAIKELHGKTIAGRNLVVHQSHRNGPPERTNNNIQGEIDNFIENLKELRKHADQTDDTISSDKEMTEDGFVRVKFKEEDKL